MLAPCSKYYLYLLLTTIIFTSDTVICIVTATVYGSKYYFQEMYAQLPTSLSGSLIFGCGAQFRLLGVPCLLIEQLYMYM